MKLKFYIDEKGKKQYTLKNEKNKKPTIESYYKFIKIRSESNSE